MNEYIFQFLQSYYCQMPFSYPNCPFLNLYCPKPAANQIHLNDSHGCLLHLGECLILVFLYHDSFVLLLDFKVEFNFGFLMHFYALDCDLMHLHNCLGSSTLLSFTSSAITEETQIFSMGSILNQAIQILSATPVFSCFFFVSFTLSINHTFRRVKSHVSINLQVFVLITFLDFY